MNIYRYRLRLVLAASLLTVLSITTSVNASFVFSEIFTAVPGRDQNHEYFEIVSQSGVSEPIAATHFVYIDGDDPGVINVLVDLGQFRSGENGIFWYQDSDGTAPALIPDPNPMSNFASGEFENYDGRGDDLENGSATYLLVQGFTGQGGDDLDFDDDGQLDIIPWQYVLDAVGWVENDGSPENDFSYAAQLGGTQFEGAALDFSGIAPDAYIRAPDGQFFVDIATTSQSPGPYALDPDQVVRPNGSKPTELNQSFRLTPGGTNDFVTTVPEPGVAVPGVGVLLALVFVRRKIRTTRKRPKQFT